MSILLPLAETNDIQLSSGVTLEGSWSELADGFDLHLPDVQTATAGTSIATNDFPSNPSVTLPESAPAATAEEVQISEQAAAGIANKMINPFDLPGDGSFVKIIAGDGFGDNPDTGYGGDPVTSDYSGTFTQSAGDVNGDGFEDLIVNSYAYSDGVYSGSTYLVFADANSSSTPPDTGAIDGSNGFVIADESGNGYAPSVTHAGDINGDGFADLVVNTYGYGDSNTSYVVFGKAGGFDPEVSSTSVGGGNGFTIDVSAFGDTASWWIAANGDVNGDGLDDLTINVSTYDVGGTYSDTTYVLYGTTGGFAANIDVASLDQIELDGIGGDGGVSDIIIDDGEFVCVLTVPDNLQTDIMIT